MRKTLAFGVFVFAAVLAACGGGGKAGLVPSALASTAPVQTPSSAKTTKATLVFHIPAPSAQQARTRRPFYITSSTQSVSILVAPLASATPSPLPTAQVFPVTTPSPCASAAAGGETCTFTVTAPVGLDFFQVNTYAVANPTASTVPLSTVVGQATVSLNPNPSASPLSFALNAVVANVTVTVPSPDPSNTPNTQVFTAGVPASPVPLLINALDSNNDPILSDPTTTLEYAVTIALVPPPNGNNAGFALSIAPQCPGAPAGTASAVSIICAADFSHVSLGYDGTVHLDASNHIADNISIVPTAPFLTSPAPAYAVLQSNVISYPLGATITSHNLQAGLLQPLSNGTIAYLVNNGTSWGIGTFTPSSGTLAPLVVGLSTFPASFAVSNDMTSVWVVDSSSGQLACWPSISTITAAPTATITSIGPDTFPMIDKAVSIDGSGNLWYVGTSSQTGQAYAGHFPAAASCGTGGTPPSAQVTLNGDASESSASISSFQNGIAYNSSSGGVYVATTLSSAVNAVAANNAGSSNGGVAVTTNATVYAGFAGNSGTSDVESMGSPYTGPMTTLLDLVPTAPLGGDYGRPSQFSVASNAGGAADRLAYTEAEYSALGVVDSVQSNPVANLVALPNANAAYATTFANDGSIDVLYGDNVGNLYIARSLLTKTWSVPATSLSGNCQGGVFTVDQLGANSGPFTITLSASLSPSAVPGTTAAMFMSIPGPSTGTGTAVVTDAHGRSETYNVTYVANGSGC